MALSVSGSARGRGPRRRDHRLLQAADAPAHARGHHLFELGQRGERDRLHAGDRSGGGGAQADGDRDRLALIEQQRRQLAARPQAVAARDAGGRVHGVAELADTFDVVTHRPRGHAQLFGQLRAGPVAAPLQQRQHAKQPRRCLHAGDRDLACGTICSAIARSLIDMTKHSKQTDRPIPPPTTPPTSVRFASTSPRRTSTSCGAG